MPIRKELRGFYRTPAWFAARKAVRERAGDRCERCRGRNGAVGYREKGRWIEIAARDATLAGFLGCRVIRIQCGACHRIPVPPMDYRVENLIFLCRGCHLLFDRGLHKRTRQARRDSQRPILLLAALTKVPGVSL